MTSINTGVRLALQYSCVDLALAKIWFLSAKRIFLCLIKNQSSVEREFNSERENEDYRLRDHPATWVLWPQLGEFSQLTLNLAEYCMNNNTMPRHSFLALNLVLSKRTRAVSSSPHHAPFHVASQGASVMQMLTQYSVEMKYQ